MSDTEILQLNIPTVIEPYNQNKTLQPIENLKTNVKPYNKY